MTAGQARMALGGFVVLALGVSINALMLQPGPGGALKNSAERPSQHPASSDQIRKLLAEGPPSPAAPAAPSSARPSPTGSSATRTPAAASPPRKTASTAKGGEERVARMKPDAASIDADTLPAEPKADSELVIAVQRELRQRGYAPAGGDGVLNDTLRAAILAYEFDSGMPLTAEPGDALLKRLLLGADAGGAAAGAGSVRSRQAERLIRSAQQGLAALGYQPGNAEGQLSPETRRALREFELDRGMIPKGRLSPEVMQRLKESLAAVAAKQAGR